MRQILVIAGREVRVELRKRSFYLFGMLSPILFLIPIAFYYVGQKGEARSLGVRIAVQSVGLAAEGGIYRGVNFEVVGNEVEPTELLRRDSVDGVLRIGRKGPRILATLYKANASIDEIVTDAEAYVWQERLRCALAENEVQLHIADQLLLPAPRVQVVGMEGNALKKKHANTMAYVLGMLLYISYILFNNNILKSVSTERASKLIEVMSLYVKPKRMMLGKLLGVTAVSLFQIAIWCVCYLLLLLLLLLWAFWSGDLASSFESATGEIGRLFQGNPFAELSGWVLLFVILGFLLNGTVSTMIAIVRSGKDRSHLLFVGNILSLLAIYFGMYAATVPASRITTFLAYFPLSSYIVVPVLTPYGVSAGCIAVSLVLLLCTVAVSLFLSLRIYERSVSQ